MTFTLPRAVPILGISLWLVSFSFAQQSNAREDVLKRYPFSYYFIQTNHDHLIQFNFVHDGQSTCAIYTLNGDWLGTVTHISPTELPSPIQQELKKISPHEIKAAYQIQSCFTYAPIYTSFVESSPNVTISSHFPPFAVAGITVWVANHDAHQGYLVDRNGIQHLKLSDSHFIGFLHHGSGRGLASQEVDEMLNSFLVPFPDELTPTAYALPGTIGTLEGWHPSIAWK